MTMTWSIPVEIVLIQRRILLANQIFATEMPMLTYFLHPASTFFSFPTCVLISWSTFHRQLVPFSLVFSSSNDHLQHHNERSYSCLHHYSSVSRRAVSRRDSILFYGVMIPPCSLGNLASRRWSEAFDNDVSLRYRSKLPLAVCCLLVQVESMYT